ncbi:hypothetical protein [Marinobacterium litorale]|uniref:hypothetical protein n=1 Tax=Marinobacterium litorale TaxID=404770 RepID=UPI00042198AB|nr:hypothetical protein [Marinobacterium litorale]
MTFEDAIVYYKTSRAIAEALEMSDARVSQMKSAGGFSYPIQCVLEIHSGRKLKARREDEPTGKAA